jgi:hypothetical protein
MESLPDIAILLHRQFKDQGRQITLHWEAWHCIGLNANIFGLMFRYSKQRLYIEIEFQMMFGWSKREIAVGRDYDDHSVFYIHVRNVF